jgi:hypothetical protein
VNELEESGERWVTVRWHHACLNLCLDLFGLAVTQGTFWLIPVQEARPHTYNLQRPHHGWESSSILSLGLSRAADSQVKCSSPTAFLSFHSCRF